MAEASAAAKIGDAVEPCADSGSVPAESRLNVGCTALSNAVAGFDAVYAGALRREAEADPVRSGCAALLAGRHQDHAVADVDR
jgi:hypothetical protein